MYIYICKYMIDSLFFFVFYCYLWVFNDVFNTNVQLAIACASRLAVPQRLWTPRGEAARSAASFAGGARLLLISKGN